MISAVDCDMLFLSRQIFEEIVVNEFPDVYNDIVILALEREHRLLKAKASALRAYKKWRQNETIQHLKDSKKIN